MREFYGGDTRRAHSFHFAVLVFDVATVVFAMTCGVTLFLHLAQVVFRPYKVRIPCDVCDLQRHEPDAVHCKACGNLLNIPDEGAY